MTRLQDECQRLKDRNLKTDNASSTKPRNWLQAWWDNVTAPVTPIADSMEGGFKRMEAKAREARKRAKVKARHDAITQITYRLIEQEVHGELVAGMNLRDIPDEINRHGSRMALFYRTATAIYDATEQASHMAQVAEGTIVKPDNT